MVKALPDILAQIVEQKKLDLASREPGVEERAERSIVRAAGLRGRAQRRCARGDRGSEEGLS